MSINSYTPTRPQTILFRDWVTHFLNGNLFNTFYHIHLQYFQESHRSNVILAKMKQSL